MLRTGPTFPSLAPLRASDAATDATTPVIGDRLRPGASQSPQGHGTSKSDRRAARGRCRCRALRLLDLIAQQTQSTRQMVFNLPYLLLQTAERPQFDLLLGKPMPTGVAQVFYQSFGRCV